MYPQMAHIDCSDTGPSVDETDYLHVASDSVVGLMVLSVAVESYK